MQIFSIYGDSEHLGCGWRQYLVLKTGRKWMTLLELGTMTPCKIAVREFGAIGARRIEYSRARIMKRLRANAKAYTAGKKLLREALRAAR